MSKLKKSLLTFAMALLLISSTFLLAACEDETQAETYNIIVPNATIPPMMALLDAIDNGNETYMWYGRPNTFASVDNLADIVSIVKQESVNQTGINNEAVSIMQNKVNQLYQKNTNSKFRFYVTD